jgi:hypothetical protein
VTATDGHGRTVKWTTAGVTRTFGESLVVGPGALAPSSTDNLNVHYEVCCLNALETLVCQCQAEALSSALRLARKEDFFESLTSRGDTGIIHDSDLSTASEDVKCALITLTQATTDRLW